MLVYIRSWYGLISVLAGLPISCLSYRRTWYEILPQYVAAVTCTAVDLDPSFSLFHSPMIHHLTQQNYWSATKSTPIAIIRSMERAPCTINSRNTLLVTFYLKRRPRTNPTPTLTPTLTRPFGVEVGRGGRSGPRHVLVAVLL